MPQCMAFDYFGIDCKKQSMLKVTPQGDRRVSMGLQRKRWKPTR